MNKRSSVLSIITSLLIALPGLWYFLSPLLTNVEVSEDFPTVVTVQVTSVPPSSLATDSPSVQATDAMATAMVAPIDEMIEKMPEPEMAVLAQGEFYSVAHAGAGTATIYQLSDGSHILRLQNFSVDNGPDLHVYLTSATLVGDSVGIELLNGIDLGELKGNIGDQNYLLPADLNLNQARSVVIWCQPFRVPFSAARLDAE